MGNEVVTPSRVDSKLGHTPWPSTGRDEAIELGKTAPPVSTSIAGENRRRRRPYRLRRRLLAVPPPYRRRPPVRVVSGRGTGATSVLGVLDLGLPGKDGIEVLRELRAEDSPLTRHAPGAHIRHLYHDREELTLVGDVRAAGE